MAQDSTWGIPKSVRSVLAARITELRVGLQEDARRQLAAWGIEPDRIGPPPGGRQLAPEDAAAREVVLAVLETRRAAGVGRQEALAAYVEEVAFTLLDRLVTFRCLEERDLLRVDGRAETLVRRDPVRGASSLVWRTRDANPGFEERAVARAAYRSACAAMTERVRVLFDPTDEPSAIFPTLPLWNQAVDALNDPAIPGSVFAEDEIMGWVYQYWSTQLKDAVYAKLAKGGKIEDPKELAAATALYTERYIVDYLVQNTLGATWVEMHPETALPATWPYYVTPPEGNPPVERERKRVRDLTLIDPCVGSGHFLVRAFDVFAQLYADEGIEAPADVPGLILERNLYGADIDRRAVQIAALALYVKGCALAGPEFRPRKLNLVACDIAFPPTPPESFLASLDEPELKDLARSLWSGLAGIRTFGSLLHPERAVNEAFAKLKTRGKGTLWADDTDWAKKRAHFMTGLRKAFTAAAGDTDLSTRLFGEEASRGLDALQILGRRYDVVVTNPPYAGWDNLDPALRQLLEREYKGGKADLYGAFIVRASSGLLASGRLGMVTRNSWLFNKTFAPLRTQLLSEQSLGSVVNLGAGAFEEITGEVVRAAAFVFAARTPKAGHRLSGLHLPEATGPHEKALAMREGRGVGGSHSPLQASFARLPGSPLIFWVADRLLAAVERGPQIAAVARAGWAAASCDNDRFLRRMWEPLEIAPGQWLPLVKAGGYRRWAGLEQWWLDWRSGGEPIREYIRRQYPYLKGKTDWLLKEDNFHRNGWTYSLMAQGSLGARLLRGDEVTDSASPAIFTRAGELGLGAILNARTTSYLLRAISPDTKFREGYTSALPLPASTPAPAAQIAESATRISSATVTHSPVERSFVRLVVESAPTPSPLPLLHALEGWNERLVFDAYELGPEDVQAVIDETGVPAGWNPLIAGYDTLPKAPEGIEIPDGLADFLATLEHRELSPPELAKVKARLRTLYEAGPGAKVEDEEPAAKADDEEEAAALGARIPIPTETFLEELAVKTGFHPIPVHWLLEELKADGVVSPPLRKAELEEYIDITLVRMLGYRWPEQDAYEAEHGPILDPDLVDADGIIPLVPCGDEPTAEQRVHTRLVRQFGDDGADTFLADLRRYTKRDLADWIRRDFFKAHTRRFKNRPIAWHLRSPEGAFEAFVLYHRLSRDTLAQLRVTYAGNRLARLRADQQRARDAGESRAVTDLQVQIEDVEAFRTTLAAIEQGTELRHRIRCRWKDETDAGRPGSYAPDIDDGVKVNIRPFQESGLLAAKVISKW